MRPPVRSRVRLRTVVVALAIAVLPSAVAAASCDPEGGDAATIAQVRADISIICDCDGVARRRDFVRCARDLVNARIDAGQLDRGCKRDVLRCVRRSTCGRPGAVACCRTSASGRTRCSIKRDPARCRAPKNGTVCTTPHQSCCDACTDSGCAPFCGNGVVEPGEDCDGDLGCRPDCQWEGCCGADFGAFSFCSPAIGQPSDCFAGGGTEFCTECICADTGIPCPEGVPIPGCTISACEPR